MAWKVNYTSDKQIFQHRGPAMQFCVARSVRHTTYGELRSSTRILLERTRGVLFAGRYVESVISTRLLVG